MTDGAVYYLPPKPLHPTLQVCVCWEESQWPDFVRKLITGIIKIPLLWVVAPLLGERQSEDPKHEGWAFQHPPPWTSRAVRCHSLKASECTSSGPTQTAVCLLQMGLINSAGEVSTREVSLHSFLCTGAFHLMRSWGKIKGYKLMVSQKYHTC